MGERFSLVYRYSKDNGVTWTDISDAVDSRETKIVQSLCTNNFTSAKDSATFTLPATDLPVKSQLVQDLLGTDDLLFEIYVPSPVQVQWDSKDAEWAGNKVMWRGRSIGFTGYIDRSSVDLKSYPLPASLTITAYDVSFLKLDEKVDQHVLLENKTVTQIVHALLGIAGYSYDMSQIDVLEDVTLEAFVIDKDKAKTYRQYIDDLLFEVGGYVLDFKPDGVARIFRLPWDDADGPVRTIDNPMGDDGIAIKSSWMQNDGVRLKWSTLSWSGADQVLWRDSIQRQIDSNGRLTGVKIQNGRYWPDGGEVVPSYMNYSAEMLDAPYLTRESRKKNEDLAIIMAKNVYAYVQATKGGNPYTFPVPAGYPVPADFQVAPYNFTSNPMIWPLKAWWLLYNNSGAEVDLQFFTVKGMALYRSKINTLETAGCSKPKEYESTYIYNASQAQRFLDFYWHFLQTSRFSMTWTEPLIDEDLGDVVQVTQKGMVYTQDAVIVAKTMKFINDKTPVITFSAVGVAVPALANGVAQSDIPQGSIPPERGASTVYAQTASTPSYTLSQWQTFGTDGYQQTWSVTNDAEFRAGDIAVIRGVISDLDNTPITLYITVTSVGSGSINGVGRSIEYVVAEMWDFDLSQNTYIKNLRLPGENNTITATALEEGHAGITISWVVKDDANTTIVTGTGDSITFSIPLVNNYTSPISIVMSGTGGLLPVTKKITVNDLTVYDHDFGAWEPDGTYDLPDHFTENGVDFDVIKGDFFVAKSTFTVDGNTYEQGKPYIYGDPIAYSWYNEMSATLANSKRMLQCLATVLNNPSIQPNVGAVYGWFRDLVAQSAVIDNLVANSAFIALLNATNALFESITVSGQSLFLGQIVNDALTTYAAQTGTRQISVACRNDALKNEQTGITSSYYSASVRISSLTTAFPLYGTYVSTSGKLSIVNSSGNTDVYTASTADPITFIYQNEFFEIRRNGITLVSFGPRVPIPTDPSNYFISGYDNPGTVNNLIVTSRPARLYSDAARYEGKFTSYQTDGVDNIEFGGYAGYAEMTSIVPKANNTHYLGTVDKKWSSIYATEVHGAVFN